MRINRVSFGQIFKTREVAEIVSGKQIASNQFLSDITGLSIDSLLSNNHTDMFVASSSYCGKKIGDINPEFKKLHNISSEIRYEFASCNLFGENDTSKLQDLFEKREKEIDAVCTKLGETVDIAPFEIPFLRTKG